MSDPHVRVTRGEPDEVELAALVAGLVAAAAADPADEHSTSAATTAWADPRRRVRGRTAWRTGPDEWRRSLRD